MNMEQSVQKESLLSDVKPSVAITKLAIPATIALLVKAIYNIVDTAYIGLLDSELALAAVGVTLPLLLIFISIENIFAAGAAVLAGRQLGANDNEGACGTISTITIVSTIIGVVLCIGGIFFMEPLLRTFGASAAVMPLAKDYAFWMFIAALANLPAQSLNCAARAESSVKITTVAIISGAILNIILDPIFMFEFGFNMGVEGASLATTISQFVTFGILVWFYWSGRSTIKIKAKYIKPSIRLFKTVVAIGIPSAVIQICLAVAASVTNMAATKLPESDMIIAAYGIVQRLVLIGSYIIMGFMQGYQPVASYAFGAKNKNRFEESVKFALKTTLILAIAVSILYILFSQSLISVFNRNVAIIEYGSKLLISQVLLFPAFGLCYMMTITFQTIDASKFGLFLSTIRQGLFYIPCVLILPKVFGLSGLYYSQPIADVMTFVVCLFAFKYMRIVASKNMIAINPQEISDETFLSAIKQ